MICQNCLSRRLAMRPSSLSRLSRHALSIRIAQANTFNSINSTSITTRGLATAVSNAANTTASPRPHGLPAATSSPAAAQPFSTPLSPAPNPVSLGVDLRPKAPTAAGGGRHPSSAAAAGMPLKGLNYTKGADDPLALEDAEYPEWLWTLLDEDAAEKKKKGGADGDTGDEFSKSKKQRRLAAKRQRKFEERLLAEGGEEALAPKVPLQRQTIDLPTNEDESVEGAIRALKARKDVTKAMREERRAKIKETNFLKTMS